jgi:sorting nexin-27
MAAESELKHDDVKKVHIDRGDHGFGFNIKGTTQTGGVLNAINGRLYPPLQYISHVDEGNC